jgi:hypothetical protein
MVLAAPLVAEFWIASTKGRKGKRKRKKVVM